MKLWLYELLPSPCRLRESIVGVIVVSRGIKYCRSQMSAYLTVSTAVIWKIFLSIRGAG